MILLFPVSFDVVPGRAAGEQIPDDAFAPTASRGTGWG